jgi:hypothetical protein
MKPSPCHVALSSQALAIIVSRDDNLAIALQRTGKLWGRSRFVCNQMISRTLGGSG